MKTAAVHSRIEPRIKKKAETILHRLGVSPTDAIRMFYNQITLRNGLPFPVEIPNATTRRALEDSRSGRGLTTHRNAKDLFASWDQ
jgi:DNA-damage-inducible protein J